MQNEYRRLATLYDIKLFCERIIAIPTDLTNAGQNSLIEVWGIP